MNKKMISIGLIIALIAGGMFISSRNKQVFAGANVDSEAMFLKDELDNKENLDNDKYISEEKALFEERMDTAKKQIKLDLDSGRITEAQANEELEHIEYMEKNFEDYMSQDNYDGEGYYRGNGYGCRGYGRRFNSRNTDNKNYPNERGFFGRGRNGGMCRRYGY